MNKLPHPDTARVVVKVGTSSLTYPNGMLNLGKIEKLARAISDIHNSGREIMLVTSGAVGAGMMKLGIREKPSAVSEKQAVAAVGQGLLMHIYEKFFAEYAKTVAQVLLTRSDTQDREKCANSRSTLLTLLRMGVIPIINENDAVSAAELKIGDNDNLSAMVAAMTESRTLVILSDIDGLYTDNPSRNSAARLIPVVKTITPEIEAMAGGSGSAAGTGGMKTKIQAAKIAVNAGASVIITNSNNDGALNDIINGEITGTLFLPKSNRLQFRKKWLSFGRIAAGKLHVDQGCRNALLTRGSSLLAVGITNIEGVFQSGQVVSIYYDSQEIARGLTNYSSAELQLIKGRKNNQIASALDGINCNEVVHRDNMVVIV